MKSGFLTGRTSFVPYLLLILTTLFWSGNFVISRGMHTEIPPLTLSFWRWFIACVLLLPFTAKLLWLERAQLREHYKFVIIQGVLGVAGFNTFIYLAMQSTTAINAVLVNSCIPVLIAICTWLFYREMMNSRQWLGVLISLGGVLLIISQGQYQHLLDVNVNPGDLLVLVAAAVWALYSANLKRYPEELHPLAYQSAIMIAGLVVLLPLYIFELVQHKFMTVNLATCGTILYVALFASVLAYIFWSKAVRAIGANRAGPFIHLMPVFSSLLAVIFLDEKLYLHHVKGILLIFVGIGLATVKVGHKEEKVNSLPGNRT